MSGCTNVLERAIISVAARRMTSGHMAPKGVLPMLPQSTTLCACGCGNPLTPKAGHGSGPKRFLTGHNSRRKWPQDFICHCGCGKGFSRKPKAGCPEPRFIRGHHSRLPRKANPKTLSDARRKELYEAAHSCCQNCGLDMDRQLAKFRRALEIHHIDHDHANNAADNLRVLCTTCHNRESVAVRDEVTKGETLRTRYATGVLVHWATGQTKFTHPGLRKMAETKKPESSPSAGATGHAR